MYKYTHPKPIIIKLTDELGFELRQKAAKYIEKNLVAGAERGTPTQQGFGILAQFVIRNRLGLQETIIDDQELGYDILLDSGVKVDVKCRGGEKSFQEEYLSSDDIPREATHNFFARQLHDDNLDADIYLMTHLEHPKPPSLPGTKRQRKWILYVCGWVSKDRVIREGVYLPPGSLTEQGKRWFPYKFHEIEFYNNNLSGLEKLEDLLKIDLEDVEKDRKHIGDLNLTSVDALRITYDLIGRGILSEKHLEFVKKKTGLNKIVKPILHSNQYFHLLNWLKEKGVLSENEIEGARKVLQEESYNGI